MGGGEPETRKKAEASGVILLVLLPHTIKPHSPKQSNSGKQYHSPKQSNSGKKYHFIKLILAVNAIAHMPKVLIKSPSPVLLFTNAVMQGKFPQHNLKQSNKEKKTIS